MPRLTFDPADARKNRQTTQQERLDGIDNDIKQLTSEITGIIDAAYDRSGDDHEPLDVQITSALGLRDDLQAMLNSFRGTSSATFSPDEQELLDLFRTGKIKFVTVELDDPANPGQTMPGKLVIDTRRARRRSSNPTPAQGSGPAPTAPTPAAPPDPSPAAQAQSTPAQPNDPTPQNPPAPVDPADPAQSNTGQPSDPPAQAGSGTTPAPTAQFEPGIIDKAKAGLAGLFRREPTS